MAIRSSSLDSAGGEGPHLLLVVGLGAVLVEEVAPELAPKVSPVASLVTPLRSRTILGLGE
jgi:hypothetical protein